MLHIRIQIARICMHAQSQIHGLKVCSHNDTHLKYFSTSINPLLCSWAQKRKLIELHSIFPFSIWIKGTQTNAEDPILENHPSRYPQAQFTSFFFFLF